MNADTVASKVPDAVASKVPAVTLGFWIIKIAATTLGETGGDTPSMTFDLGYLVSTLIFAAVLVILIACQIAAKKFHPFLCWGDDHRLDHGRHDARGFRRPLARHRLSRRLAAARLRARLTRTLVPQRRHGVGRHRQHPSGRGVLMAHHHLLADPRVCGRTRLKRGQGAAPITEPRIRDPVTERRPRSTRI